MIKLKDLLSEGKFQMKGKYLYMPTGEVSSIPGTYEPDSIIVNIKRDEFKIYQLICSFIFHRQQPFEQWATAGNIHFLVIFISYTSISYYHTQYIRSSGA